jgi:hypothetical protein
MRASFRDGKLIINSVNLKEQEMKEEIEARRIKELKDLKRAREEE